MCQRGARSRLRETLTYNGGFAPSGIRGKVPGLGQGRIQSSRSLGGRSGQRGAEGSGILGRVFSFPTGETTDLTESPDVTAAGDLTYLLLPCQLTIQKNTEITYHC